jgi:hypothetical protein
VVPGFARYVVTQGFSGDSTVTQTLFSSDETDFEITGVESPYPFVEATFREAKPDERNERGVGRQWVVATKISPEAPVGALTEPVVIRLQHPKQPSASFPLSGIVRPMFVVTPSIGDWGELEIKEREVVSFVVKNYADEDVELTKVELALSGIETKIDTVTKGHIFEVKLTLTPEMPKGAVDQVMRISTSSKRHPVLEVPIKFTIL